MEDYPLAAIDSCLVTGGLRGLGVAEEVLDV